jgi:hypothetical protein
MAKNKGALEHATRVTRRPRGTGVKRAPVDNQHEPKGKS